MGIAILQSTTASVSSRRGFSLAGLIQRIQRLGPRRCSRPQWSHVPERVWRRHSAMLTYSHEASADHD